MNFGPILDTINLRERRLLEVNIIKLHITQSDIMFLTYCKKCDIIPNGLRLRNPFKSQTIAFNKGRHICDQAGRLAIKAAINNAYRKQRLLQQDIWTSQQNLLQRSPHTYKRLQDNWTFTATYKRRISWNTRYINFSIFVDTTLFSNAMPVFFSKVPLVFLTKETDMCIPPNTPTWLTYPTLNYHLSTSSYR